METTIEAPLIAAVGVGVCFGELPVLSGVDMAVAPGEIVTLIGPNGAGKTTLIRVLLGLLEPESGQVIRRPGLRIGYVPQRFALDPVLPLTVRRLLAMGRRKGRQAIAQALEEVRALPLGERSVHDLSGGELQRVLLARAILRDPDLLILDEPSQGVDVAGQVELYRLVTRIRDRHGCGVLMISHDLHVVMADTDRVICLNRHVCCSGHPEAVSRHPEYAALFGPRAADALAVYTHHHDHRHTLHGDIVARTPDRP